MTVAERLDLQLLADCALAADLANFAYNASPTEQAIAKAALDALDLPASYAYRRKRFKGLCEAT